MSKLSWGKPRLFVKELDADLAKWRELNTPAEGTTELQASKGDKLEAPVEGGQNEDVKYKHSLYAIVYAIRKMKGRAVPIPSTNGVASKRYAVALMPEDSTALGFYVEQTSATVDDTFNASDGAMWAIQHDAIAATSGNTVKWGTVTVDSTGDEPKLKFTETQPAEGATAKSFEEGVTLLAE